MNNKNRLFELFEKINNLKPDKEAIIKEFIEFAGKELGILNKLPEISITYEDGVAKKLKSFGGYMPNEHEIRIVGTNRNLADILRTLGHELVHHKQNLEGKISANSGETGSDEENEANVVAGVLLRNFGKLNDNIYE
jgi:Zn-dependent peptidase ImmA (M78 family)